MFNLIDAALVRWVETANAFNFITEEIEAQANFASRREEVDDAAADGKLTRVGNGIDTEIAIGLKQGRKPFAANFPAGGQTLASLANTKWRHIFLDHRANGGDDQLLFFCGLLKRLQRCHALRGYGHRWRRPVIRQAIPTWENQYLKFGREKWYRVGYRAHGGFIRRNIQRACFCRPCQVGQQQRHKAIWHRRKR